MIKATDLRAGVTFLKDGKPYLVLKYSLIKVGRGGATVKVNAKNLDNESVEDLSLSSNLSVEEADTFKKKLQYLYKGKDNVCFMDPKTYEQVEISDEVLGERINFIKEGEQVDVLYWKSSDGKEKALSIDLVPKVSLKVKECDPGVKGNSASNFLKSAVLENGLKVKVPLFIKVGDVIRIDTKTGDYVERSKE